MLGFSLILLPMAVTGGRRISRVEGAMLLVLYGGYTGWLLLR
jgi:Ca2+/Na+ antiporter